MLEYIKTLKFWYDTKFDVIFGGVSLRVGLEMNFTPKWCKNVNLKFS